MRNLDSVQHDKLWEVTEEAFRDSRNWSLYTEDVCFQELNDLVLFVKDNKGFFKMILEDNHDK